MNENSYYFYFLERPNTFPTVSDCFLFSALLIHSSVSFPVACYLLFIIRIYSGFTVYVYVVYCICICIIFNFVIQKFNFM